MTVLIICECHNKLPQYKGLIQHAFIISQLCRLELQHGSHWAEMKTLADRGAIILKVGMDLQCGKPFLRTDS